MQNFKLATVLEMLLEFLVDHLACISVPQLKGALNAAQSAIQDTQL